MPAACAWPWITPTALSCDLQCPRNRGRFKEQPHLVGSEPVAGEPRPVGRGLALLDPLLRRPAPVVEADDGPVGPGQGGHDEADPREQLAEVMLDLGDHPPRPVPGRGPI